MVFKMLSIALYKKELKSNFMLFVIFSGLILLYGGIVATMFTPDPEAAGWLDAFSQMYPEMMEFIGFSVDNLTNYGSFIAGYLYGMLFIMFGLIFTILLTNRLVFRYLDKGSMAYLIATPNARSKILFTQIKVIGTYLFAMVSIMFLVLGIIGFINNPDYVDWFILLYMNFSFLMLLVAISGMTVFASALFDGKLAFGLNVFIPVLFFLLKMIGNLGVDYQWARYLTPFSLFNTDYIINLESISILYNVILLSIGGLLYALTIYLFKKRDLSI